MAGLSELKVCLKTEITLDQIAGGLYDFIETGRSTYQIANALESNANTSLTEVVSASKKRPGDLNCTDVDVTVKYMAPDCGDLADGCVDFTCGVSTNQKDDYSFDQVTMSDCVSDEFSVSAEEFSCGCESVREQLARSLARSVRKGYKKYNTALGTKLVAAAGSPYGSATLTNVTPLDLKIFRDLADGSLAPQPMGFHAMKKEYRRQAPNTALEPIAISGSEKYEAYQFSQKVFAGNSDGLDSSRIGMNGIHFDPALTGITNGVADEPTITFLPGSASLLKFYEFDTPDHTIGAGGRVTWVPITGTGTLIRQKVDIGTSILGVPFVVDMQIEFDECVGKYGTVTYKWRKMFDLWSTPQGAFCSGDTHNFILLWDVSCAAYACADIA